MRNVFLYFSVILLLHSNAKMQAQITDSTSSKNKRFKHVLIAETGIYAATMFGLNQLWYKDYPREKFHFFNDNKEWLQVDKVGHAFSAYYLGLVGMEAYRWAGVSKTKQIWVGGSLGWLFLSSIEIFDGFSQGWGFSYGDMFANTGGFLMAAAQQHFFDRQVVMLKFSSQASPYAKVRPNVLGSNFSERFMKDYNGQTYWLSFTLADIVPLGEKFPGWLALAVGYGAKGMYGGFDNVWESKGATYDFNSVKREREFYISLDINLWRIKTKNKALQSIFKTIGFLKVPMPAYEFKSKKFYPFYF